MNIDLDWALVVAYNSALQAGHALMYARGYCPKGADKHKTVIRFLKIALDASYKSRLNRLDRIRRKRHQVVYRMAGVVSEQEAKDTIKFAEAFVAEVARLVP